MGSNLDCRSLRFPEPVQSQNQRGKYGTFEKLGLNWKRLKKRNESASGVLAAKTMSYGNSLNFLGKLNDASPDSRQEVSVEQKMT